MTNLNKPITNSNIKWKRLYAKTLMMMMMMMKK